ncbi:hypothetical protein V2S66_23710 [Streptomyces sp. V4-01]|uniref:Uncharacterized protein n=1 Tax=Actinacidiphila polyblastidii TaxID=3110430 RepID=A0ABU7PGP3_9ACTN|nr:hypothetical protein [Streptomyces sp. V4-01]
MTPDSSPGPEEEPSGSPVPDDVWELFLHDNERDIEASAPKELSARARVAARRIREEKERAAARGDRRPGLGERVSRPADGGPVASTTAAARRAARQREKERRNTRRQLLHNLIGILVVFSMVLLALSPGRAWSMITFRGLNGGSHAAAAPAVTLGPETARPAGPPAAVSSRRPTLKRPFAGSPAESWGDGAAAIVPPTASAYFAVSSQRVADGLRLAKDLLVAGSIDPAVVPGAGVARVVALIDPHADDAQARVLGALAHPTAGNDPTTLFSRFGPEVRLVGAVVKVRGRMTVGLGDTYGGARIVADYTFVYPVRKTSDTGNSPEITRTVVRRTLTIELPADIQRPSGLSAVALSGWTGSAVNGGCGFHDGFLHPYFADGRTAPGGPTRGGTLSGPAVDPYDRSGPAPGGDGGCVRAERI